MIRPISNFNYASNYLHKANPVFTSKKKKDYSSKNPMLDCNYILPEKEKSCCVFLNDKLNSMLDNVRNYDSQKMSIRLEGLISDGTILILTKFADCPDSFQLKIDTSKNIYKQTDDKNYIFVVQSPDVYEKPKAFLRQCDDKNIVKTTGFWNSDVKVDEDKALDFLRILDPLVKSEASLRVMEDSPELYTRI